MACRAILTTVLLSLSSALAWAQVKPVIIAHPQVTRAAAPQEKVYRSQQQDGVAVFSDLIPAMGDYDVLLFDCYACNPNSTVDWYQTPLFQQHYQPEIAKAAKLYQLEPALIRAVIHAESAFKSSALSKTGAMGLMQLMPKTAAQLGVHNAYAPGQNIDGGSRYLAQLLTRFKGDIPLACAAYNAGPSTVENYRGIPPYPETKSYVERVGILLQRYRAL